MIEEMAIRGYVAGVLVLTAIIVVKFWRHK